MSTKKITKYSKKQLEKKAATERIKARQAETAKKEQQFMENTVDAKSFLIEDVIGDGACMFRALANDIYYSSPLHSAELENKHKKEKKQIIYQNLANMKHQRQHYDVEKRDDTEWGWSGDCQEIVARKLQKIALMYIREYQNQPVDGDDSKLILKDVVETVHELDFDSYLYHYQFFAGDTIEVESEGEEAEERKDSGDSEECEDEHHEENNDTDDESEESEEHMVDRWGGFPEQYAISKIFDRPIYVYSAEKWNSRTNKINAGTIRNNKFIKNVRLRLYDIVNRNANGEPLYLLWSKTKRHYYAMMLNIPSY